MKKIIFLTILTSFFFLFQTNFVLAATEHNHESEIEEGKKLAESGVSCDKLNEEQFEAIGEYLMEKMHPGESHEAMHKIMGMEEGTEYHKQFHINIAKTTYCGEGGIGMMNMMPMMNTGNMMGWNNWGLGSSWGWSGWIFMILVLVWIILGVLGVLGIIVLVKWIIKK